MQRLSEGLAVVATVDPAAIAASTVNTDAIDMKNFRRVVFIVAVGTMGAGGTADFAVYGDTASGGSYATAITGKSITQLTKAGSDDNKQAIVEVTAEEVSAQGLRYIRGALVIGTATSPATVIALAGGLRHSPASEHDLASVDEIVA